MSISYLHNIPWQEWSREERFFCLSLYEHAKQDIKKFAALISKKSGLNFSSEENWDLGFEVCLYRDVLFGVGRKVSETDFSVKRTFDLCLFSESKVIIIEAKVASIFTTTDITNLNKDKQDIPVLIQASLELKKGENKTPNIEVLAIALASSTYFKNHDKHGKKEILKSFDGRITWNDMYDAYSDPILKQANRLYKPKKTTVVID